MVVNATSETGTFQQRIEAINIQLGDEAGSKMQSLSGQLIYSGKTNALQQTVKVDAKGVYILRVKTADNRMENHKIVSH